MGRVSSHFREVPFLRIDRTDPASTVVLALENKLKHTRLPRTEPLRQYPSWLDNIQRIAQDWEEKLWISSAPSWVSHFQPTGMKVNLALTQTGMKPSDLRAWERRHALLASFTQLLVQTSELPLAIPLVRAYMATNGNSYFDMNFSSPLGEINAEINIRKSLENSHLIFTFTQSEPAASHLEHLGYIGQVRFEAGSGENTIPYLTVITHRVWEETPIPVVPVPEAVPASEETPAPEATAVSEMAPTLEVAP